MATTQKAEGTGIQEKGQELVSGAQEHTKEKAKELTSEVGYELKDQVDYRSTQAGEQIQSIGGALRQSSEQLRNDGDPCARKGRETQYRAACRRARLVPSVCGCRQDPR